MAGLLLLRHGQSAWNVLGRWQGHADPPLSDLGRRQAAAAAGIVGPVDAVFTSDLRRASQTAAILAEALGLAAPVPDPDLRERDAGEWTGLTSDEIEHRWPGYLTDRRRPPGFEGDESLLGRSRAALTRVASEHPTDRVLVVTHGGVINAIQRHLGARPEPVANLAGRWVTANSARFVLGEQVSLVAEGADRPPERD